MNHVARKDPDFDAAGPLGAPAIVLVHGSVVTRKMWLPQLRGLSNDYRVLAPDLPGHGTLADAPFTFAAAQQSLADLIRQEAQGRALVAGLSLGGYIAMQLAHQQPDLVAGLVLSGCSFNFVGPLGLYLRIVSGLMRGGWLKQSQERAAAKTRRMFPPALADVAEAQLQAGVYPEPLGPSFAEMAGRDFAIEVTGYPGPVLILNGERDKAARGGEAKFLAASPSVRAQIVPEAGHACNLDRPEAYNRAVSEFARSIGWASTAAD